MFMFRRVRLSRHLIVRFLTASAALGVFLLFTEFALEARDVTRYTRGQTFAAVGNSRIRYQLLGAEHSGATVVMLTGMIGSIEQFDEFQRNVAAAVPALVYDRGGYGFSEGSTAHSAYEQAGELAALLDALEVRQPIVLVAYSMSSHIARVFAGRFPERLASMYLIEPAMPELDKLLPQRHGPLRHFARFVATQLLASSLGYTRFTRGKHTRHDPASHVEQRAEAVLARRPHYWALAREWHASLVTQQQTLDAPVPLMLPLEVVYSRQFSEDETSKALREAYTNFVDRSSRGTLVEIESTDHSQLLKTGPALDRMVARIVQFARAPALN